MRVWFCTCGRVLARSGPAMVSMPPTCTHEQHRGELGESYPKMKPGLIREVRSKEDKMEMGHYSEPFKGEDGKWYFHLKAANGEIVMQSEGYATKEHAAEGVEAAVKASSEAYEGRESV